MKVEEHGWIAVGDDVVEGVSTLFFAGRCDDVVDSVAKYVIIDRESSRGDSVCLAGSTTR